MLFGLFGGNKKKKEQELPPEVRDRIVALTLAELAKLQPQHEKEWDQLAEHHRTTADRMVDEAIAEAKAEAARGEQ